MRSFAIVFLLFTAAIGVFARPPVERSTTSSIAAILTDLNSKVSDPVNKLFQTTSHSTREDVESPVNAISGYVQDAIDSLNALKGQPADVVLASVDGTTTLSSTEIGSLLGSILKLIFDALGVILHVLTTDILKAVFPLLITLGKLLCTLLSAVATLVSGILVVVATLLRTVLSVLDELGITELLDDILGTVL